MNGIERIAAERKRQVERWTLEHDDRSIKGEMAQAAGCYALSASRIAGLETMRMIAQWCLWPWGGRDKRSIRTAEAPSIDDRIRDLEKAGALCAAEIDRLLRLRAKGEPASGAPPPSVPGRR